MIKLSRQDFQALNQEDKDLAKKLGITFDLEKVTRRSHSKCIGGEPYILIVTTSCRLCNSSSTRIFRMSLEKSFLYSEEIAGVPSGNKLKVKTSSYTVRCCQGCYTYLQNLTKVEITQKFLTYIQDVRNFIK